MTKSDSAKTRARRFLKAVKNQESSKSSNDGGMSVVCGDIEDYTTVVGSSVVVNVSRFSKGEIRWLLGVVKNLGYKPSWNFIESW